MTTEDQVPASSTPGADADALADQLVRLTRLIERTRAELAARCPTGVERAAYVLLAQLVIEGPQRLCALADAVHSDPSTVSRQVAQLVQLGLARRQPDPSDGRAARFSATQAGRAAFAEHRRIRNQHIAGVLTGWTGADIGHLVTLLDRLNTDLERYRARLAAGGRRAPLP